jgi:hypothetical protein
VKRDAKTQAGAKRRAARRSSKVVTWIGAAAAAALVVYGISQMSNIAYGEKELSVINFSDLNPSQKRTALEAANTARCTCGCGMTLAQCVSTDSTCPLRDGNITRINGMVADAQTP